MRHPEPPLSPRQPGDADAALQLAGLRFGWPGQPLACLDIESLQVAPGQTLFLRGPSGCGKSTLLSLLAGVLVADAGRVQLLGQDWAALPPARRDRHRADHLGYIFQQFNLLPYLSLLDNVRLPCRFSPRRAQRAGGAAGDGGQQAAERLLARSGLARSLWQQSAGSLSVGQQQRVAAARALIGAPEVVIADEPTSALDEDLREAFMDLLLSACAEAGAALIFVSHDSRLAARFERVLDLPSINRAAPREAAASASP